MLQARVDVRLSADFLDLVKVMNIHVAEHTSQALENVLADLLKILWELLACKENQSETKRNGD